MQRSTSAAATGAGQGVKEVTATSESRTKSSQNSYDGGCLSRSAGRSDSSRECRRRHHLSSSTECHDSSGERLIHRHTNRQVCDFFIHGETKFPSTMSYLSDAQRSDGATVCSGSVTEDIEVESIISQEDQPSQARHSPSSLEKTFQGRRVGLNGRAVEFVEASFQVSSRKPSVSRKPFSSYATSYQLKSLLDGDGGISLHSMGPPLSRALLMHKEGASSRGSGSVKSFDSNTSCVAGTAYSDDGGGSLDVETHSYHSQDEGNGCNLRSGKESSSQTSSTKSFWSHAGGDTAAMLNTDNLQCSLESESRTLSPCPIYTIDDVAALLQSGQAVQLEEVEAMETTQVGTLPVENGRISPGGTIYKGIGTRRYQGRYMHLPLKRFHQNGIHLDAVNEGETEENRHGEFQEYHSNDPRLTVRDGALHPYRDARRRSRSRSRSPSCV
jgi:hypothetical protein